MTKKKMKRKIHGMLLLSILLISAWITDVDAASSTVSVRNVFEAIGATVTWDEGGRTIGVKRGDSQIRLTVGSKVAYKNGTRITLTQPIQINPQNGAAEISTQDVYTLAKTTREMHYRVQPTDSLWSIAERFDITVDQLVYWNQLSVPTIYPGQHLHVTDPYYVVQQGDSLSEIAKKTESSVEEIKKANGLQTDFLLPGQKLWVPPQASIQPPNWFKSAVFPLIKGTYHAYQNDYGNARSFSTTGKGRSHEGIDIYANQWVPIFSTDNGRIVRMGWNTYGGWRLSIQAENGIAFYYAHLAGYAPGIQKGQWVKKGQLIGYVGSTGYGAEGTVGMFEPHLHFGMYDTKMARWKSLNPYWLLRWWESQ